MLGIWAGKHCTGFSCSSSLREAEEIQKNPKENILIDIRPGIKKNFYDQDDKLKKNIYNEGDKLNSDELQREILSEAERQVKDIQNKPLVESKLDGYKQAIAHKRKGILDEEIRIAPRAVDNDMRTPSERDLDIKYEIPAYIQIREADTPTVGDFHCGGSAVENCCAFYIRNIEEGKKICNSYRDYCKGFVLSSLSTDTGKIEYLMYLKTTVSSLTINYVTDFFVKVKFVQYIGWRTEYKG